MSTYPRNCARVAPAPSRRLFLAGATSALVLPALPLLGADNPTSRPAKSRDAAIPKVLSAFGASY